MVTLSVCLSSSILAVSLQEKIAAFDSCTFTKKFFVTSKKDDPQRSHTESLEGFSSQAAAPGCRRSKVRGRLIQNISKCHCLLLGPFRRSRDLAAEYVRAFKRRGPVLLDRPAFPLPSAGFLLLISTNLILKLAEVPFLSAGLYNRM